MARSWRGGLLLCCMLPLGGCVALSDADLVFRTGKGTVGGDSGSGPADSGSSSPDDSDPVDADGDGFPEGEDCDDDAAAVNPGADEVCDGLDNNCDGVTDDDAIDQSTWYTDADSDGYGDGTTAATSCGGDGLVEVGGDCDDDDDHRTTSCPSPRTADVDLVAERCEGDDDGVYRIFSDDVDQDGARIGVSVAGGQDWDGDGVPDLVVGAPGDGTAGVDSAAHRNAFAVVSGTPGGDVFLELTGRDYTVPEGGCIEQDMSSTAVLLTERDIDESHLAAGSQVALLASAEGPVLAVGAPNEPEYRGVVMLVTGRGGTTSSAALTGPYLSAAGYALANAGDVDGDELDDLLVGGFTSDTTKAAVWLLYGAAMTDDLDLPSTSSDEVTVWDSVGGYFGSTLSGVGDVDGNGTPDLMMGSANTPAGYLVLAERGGEGPGGVTFDDLLGYYEASVAGPGWPALTPSAAGDLNADGYDDFTLAVADFNDHRGAVFVVLGGDEDAGGGLDFPYNSAACVSDLSACADHRIVGDVIGDYLGYGSPGTGTGDLNGDDVDDLVVGAPSAGRDGVPDETGMVYVFYGSEGETGFIGSIETAADDADLIALGEAEGERVGQARAIVADANMDGCDELLIGAPGAGAGTAWLVSGCTD